MGKYKSSREIVVFFIVFYISIFIGMSKTDALLTVVLFFLTNIHEHLHIIYDKLSEKETSCKAETQSTQK